MPKARQILIEPLDAHTHDRAAFSSGVEPVDNFLQKTAGKLMKGGTARVFVAVDPEEAPKTVLGFYSMNVHSGEYKALPGRYRRYSLPGDNIPAAFIGMMGVTTTAQGQGLGSLLLADALKGAYLASRRVGTAVVMLDVIDCGNPAAIARRQKLYEGFGFQCLPSRKLRMFLPVATIADAL
ncbi:MAG TPA: GNAT family N-acetyltransferase [Marinobacter sp.]|uniref:GNAT family N-acetyltransferase n=1 Tax=Marinobacter sp. TaxID=50741 RepID=UPI002D7FFE3F|nr:GNAT family N-acetyltransferase [Marinobacter sp.]HET8800785.1 GNAT family N-acetyltransferase [Marinobacter sp.]